MAADQTVLRVDLPGEGRPWKVAGPDVEFRIRGVRTIRPLERALIGYLPRVEGRAIVPLPAGDVAMAAAMATYSPDAHVEVFELDAHAFEVGMRKTEHLANVEHVLASDVQESPCAAQCAMLAIHKSRDRLLMFDILERLAHVMHDGSELLVAVAKKRSSDFVKKLAKITVKGGVVAKCHEGVVFRGLTGKKNAGWTPRVARFSASTPTEAIELTSRPGVFSHGRADMGGIALAESAEVSPSDRVLDLGCGGGLVGLLLAERMRRQGDDTVGTVVLVDSNARAIECARHNIEINGLSNVEAILTHAYATREPSFDVVVGNPPYYASRRIAQSFLDTAQKVLKPGGTAYLVSKHGAELAAHASAAGFGVEACRRRGYDITVARKTADHK